MRALSFGPVAAGLSGLPAGSTATVGGFGFTGDGEGVVGFDVEALIGSSVGFMGWALAWLVMGRDRNSESPDTHARSDLALVGRAASRSDSADLSACAAGEASVLIGWYSVSPPWLSR